MDISFIKPTQEVSIITIIAVALILLCLVSLVIRIFMKEKSVTSIIVISCVLSFCMVLLLVDSYGALQKGSEEKSAQELRRAFVDKAGITLTEGDSIDIIKVYSSGSPAKHREILVAQGSSDRLIKLFYIIENGVLNLYEEKGKDVFVKLDI